VPYDPPSIGQLSIDENVPVPDLKVRSVTYGPPILPHHPIEEDKEHHRSRDPSLPMSAADKVESLKQRATNWETLNHSHSRTITVEGPARVYELQEGIFLMCEGPEDDDADMPVS
jgi:hypothetical protein